MKLKYYLRGLAVGILVTTIILAISFSQKEKELSDQEVINRAKQLGMVMADSGLKIRIIRRIKKLLKSSIPMPSRNSLPTSTTVRLNRLNKRCKA